MSLIHEKLYQSANLTQVDFDDYVRSLVTQLAASYSLNPHNVGWHLDLDPLSLSLDVAIPCGLLLNELVSNALKHAFVEPPHQGRIDIKVCTAGDRWILTVRDNGIGIDPDLLNLNSTSLGLRLVRALTRQLQGDLRSYNDQGATFQVSFPKV
jgi:two-component sensor histidine kinase